VSEAGANAVRILPNGGVWYDHPYGKKSQFCQFAYVNETQGWNLSAWNENFFDITRAAIEIINDLGMTAFYCLADNCELFNNQKNRVFSPWVSNTHTGPEIKSIYDTAAYPHWSAFITKCISEFSGLDIIWSLGNEMINKSFRELVSGPNHTISGGVVFPLIDSGALVPNKMTYGAILVDMTYDPVTKEYTETPFSTLDLIKKDVGVAFSDEVKLSIYKEIHGCGRKLIPADSNRPYGCSVDQAISWWHGPIRKIFSDDGVRDGESTTDVESDGTHKLSAAQWQAMALYILSRCSASSNARDHLVNFEHLPSNQSDTVQAATFKAISTAYHERFGTWPKNYVGSTVVTTGNLTVTLAPAGAIAAGAQWNVDYGAWQDSGDTVTSLAVGTHTVYYKATTGYTSPITATAIIADSETTTKIGTYVLGTDSGSLKVTIIPAAVVAAGAKWMVDGGAENDSEATVSGLTVGNHAVTYKAVSLYTAPSTEVATIVKDVTKLLDDRQYILTAATGSLTVTLLPSAAVTAGAHWNIDGGDWQDSGATETDLALGDHAVRYQETVGYTAPVPETVTIT
jgi:hypothetical protein